jgi:hypothetical protein
LVIYDINGRKLKELKKDFRLNKISSGIYFIKIDNKDYKLIILK